MKKAEIHVYVTKSRWKIQGSDFHNWRKLLNMYNQPRKLVMYTRCWKQKYLPRCNASEAIRFSSRTHYFPLRMPTAHIPHPHISWRALFSIAPKGSKLSLFGCEYDCVQIMLLSSDRLRIKYQLFLEQHINLCIFFCQKIKLCCWGHSWDVFVHSRQLAPMWSVTPHTHTRLIRSYRHRPWCNLFACGEFNDFFNWNLSV